MKQHEEHDPDDLLVRYLLGRLPEEEQIELERRYFADDELFDRLLAIDADLADAYVAGELSPGERQSFESRLRASPRRQEKVEFAAAWNRLASEALGQRPAALARVARPPEAGPAPRSAGIRWRVAAALVLAAGGSWLAFQSVSWREQRTRLEADRASLRGRIVQLERDLDREQSQSRRLSEAAEAGRRPPGEPRSVSFSLVRGSLRDADDSNRLVIPKNAEVIFLEMSLEDTRQEAYRTAIERVTGELLWEQRRLRPRLTKDGKVVVLTLGAAALSPGDYIVRLSGETPAGRPEELASYYIQVSRD